jgi:hypothetical protein
LYSHAVKTNTLNPWFAWIPIANILLMCKIAGKPDWWGFLFFIPVANIVIALIVWIGVAKKLNVRSWLSGLMFFPFLIYMITLNCIILIVCMILSVLLFALFFQ